MEVKFRLKDEEMIDELNQIMSSDESSTTDNGNTTKEETSTDQKSADE